MEPTRTLLRATVERIGATTPSELKHRLSETYITAHNEDGHGVRKWSWWECLYHESRSGRAVRILDRGVWFSIQEDFARKVLDYAKSLAPSGLGLPDAKRNEIEEAYNIRAVGESAGTLRLLDRKLVTPIPGESRIEVCDIFGASGHLVHVKRRKGGSAGLSHLFGQALVSSQLLMHEARYCAELRAQLQDWSGVVKDPPVPAEHPIVLAVMLAAESKGEGATGLPFFSKVFLRQNALQLTSMGFTVHYDEIAAPLVATAGRRAGGPAPPHGRRRKALRS